jgi:hypothetical protein
MDRQLFILDDQVWESMSFHDVDKTIVDMIELGIDQPPCRHFDVITKAEVVDRIFRGTDPNYNSTMSEGAKSSQLKWIFDFAENVHNYTADMQMSNYRSSFLNRIQDEEKREKNKNFTKRLSGFVLCYLLVALAAKNSVKTVKENKLMKLGIGKKKEGKYRYTTTVTIGKITETEGTGEGGGWTVRPHLRRGHIREQRYGPNMQYSKKIFIQPVFVNASEDFINERKAYNVRVAS